MAHGPGEIGSLQSTAAADRSSWELGKTALKWDAPLHRFSAFRRMIHECLNTSGFEPSRPLGGPSHSFAMSPFSALSRTARVLIAIIFGLLSLATTHAQQDTVTYKAATLTLVADTTAIQPGKPFTAGVRWQLEPTWDMYWQFVGDLGQPTSVTWELPPGFKAGELQWPLPVSHNSFDTFFNYVYFGETFLFAEITPPADLPPGPITIKAKVAWQMCDPKTCVPGHESLALQLPTDSAQPANADLFAKWRAQLPKTTAPPFTVTWDCSQAKEFSLRLEGLSKDVPAEFFPLPPVGMKPGHPTTSEIADNGTRTIKFPVEDGKPNLPWRGVIVTGKEGAAREGWLVSSTEKTPAASATTTAATAPEKSSASNPAPAATPPPASPSDTKATSAQPSSEVSAPAPSPHGLFTILWSAFLGGLILNLMPCVLPVIALKIFGFVQQAGEHPRRVFHLGLAFVAGVFAFFLGMATLIAVLHANGIRLNWGFQFQHPGIFVGLIALVFLFGLNLLGVFEITLSGGTASKLSELSSREGYGGAFFHGLFTTLLGTSCTAPFLGAALGAAFAAPTYIVYLIFTAIAAGMSLPYFLLTAKPAWMRFLPKPGTWMERLKQLVGFVMLAVVIWLLGVLGESRGLEPLIDVSSFLLLLALACWIYGAFGTRVTSWLAIIVVLASGYFVFLHGKLDTPRPKLEASLGTNDASGISWQPWTAQRVAEAMKNGQPVFIDFTAEWCLNCKANEKFVLNTEPVKAALKEKNVLTLKADWTDGDPAITAVLAKYGRAGVPAYLLYPGNGAEPTLFPEILTQSVVLNELGKLKSERSAALVPGARHSGS